MPGGMRLVVVLGLLCIPACEASKEAGEAEKPKAAEKLESKVDAPSDAKPETKPETKPNLSTTRAIILADDALRRMTPSGKLERIVDATGYESCQVDRHHRVTWLAADTELGVYDPEDGRVQKIVVDIPGGGRNWQVEFKAPDVSYPITAAGSAKEGTCNVGVVVRLGDQPRVRGGLIAEQDWLCYDDSEKLPAEDEKRKKAIDEAKLVGKEILVALEARRTKLGLSRRVQLKPPGPAPRVEVDKGRCEEEDEEDPFGDNCGAATYFGGGRLWSVTTDNGRGDLFHVTKQLYDTKTKTWWDPATDARTAQPGDGEEGRSFEVSPDGTWAILGDKVLSLTEAKVTGELPGTFCGWE